MNTPICTTDDFGTISYRLNGELHRTGGLAVIFSNGIQVWYQKGKRHRVNGPAIIYSDGTEEFWLNDNEVDVIVHFLQRP